MEDEELLDEVVRSAEAIGALTGDEDHFRAAVDAFRAADADSFQRLARQLKIFDRCHLVCRWLCSKECVLLCLELVGPPRDEELPDPAEFAEVVTRITADEDLVERLAIVVAERDPDGFKTFVAELQIQHFAHLLCHWACFIRCRFLCAIVCSAKPTHGVHFVEALKESGSAIGEVIRSDAFPAVAEAAFVGNCEVLRGTLGRIGLANRCHIVCEWFCSIRCLRICRILCVRYPAEPLEHPLSEAFEFARATARLAAKPEHLRRLVDAMEQEDADAFGAIVEEFELGRFCVQLCHWICSFHCHRFCRCVCRPVLQPWFTHVGHFGIYADIDAGTGLTNKALSYAGLYHHGGPDFAFYGCLELRGFCPTTSPTFPGAAMRYRFLYEHPAGTTVPITGSLVCEVDAGTRQVDWPQNVGGIAGAAPVPTFQTVKVAGAIQPDPTPPAPGAPWFGPSEHVIAPDPQGWIEVDADAIGGGFQTLIGFNTPALIAGGNPNPGVAAGAAIPPANQRTGTAIGIIFEATRVAGPVSPPDFTNALASIHINNWTEVNLLDLLQFHTGGGTPCSPITTDLDVEFTADHERMEAWAVSITSASPSAPNTVASGTTPRGGSGTHHENTTAWQPCSYIARLSTRAGQTTGLIDNQGFETIRTFCISGTRPRPPGG